MCATAGRVPTTSSVTRPSRLRRDRPGRSPTLALTPHILLPTLAGAQATVTGKATAAGQPIVDVRVLVRGTSLTTTTNAQGVYTLRNVPTGAQIIEALRVGYRAQQANVQVTGARRRPSISRWRPPSPSSRKSSRRRPESSAKSSSATPFRPWATSASASRPFRPTSSPT